MMEKRDLSLRNVIREAKKINSQLLINKVMNKLSRIYTISFLFLESFGAFVLLYTFYTTEKCFKICSTKRRMLNKKNQNFSMIIFIIKNTK